MFTGLVESTGRVRQATTHRGSRVFRIAAGFSPELRVGESVSVSGCCLTVTEADRESFRVEAVATTLRQTSLAGLRVGAEVNLERALKAGDRLGGHYVQGHVDEVGTVRRVERRSGQLTLAIGIAAQSERMLTDKGSVAVDGVSLTVADLRSGEFTVNVIPHTWETTTLRSLRPGHKVNIEYDAIVKSVQQYLRKVGR